MKSTPDTVPAFTGIVDIHHNDGRYDLDEVMRGGVVAMIHKCTQGKDWSDPAFANAMRRAKALGMLRGAYHFASGSADGRVQAEHFIRSIGADLDDHLLALDWETNPDQTNGDMTLDNVRLFISTVRTLSGRYPFLYSFTHYFKAHTSTADTTLARAPLWQSQFGERPGWHPFGLPHYDLWQYTNGKDGPSDTTKYPRHTRGFEKPGQDRSVFHGTEAELREAWLKWGRWS